MRNVVEIVVRVSLAVKSTVLNVGLNTGDLKKTATLNLSAQAILSTVRFRVKGVIINHFQKMLFTVSYNPSLSRL